MRVQDLAPNPQNPRTISPAKLSQLKKSMLEFGDLSGIVFNTQTNRVVGGTQRTRNIEAGAKVTLTKTFSKPSKTGTVAIGYILQNEERFSYRAVKWSEQREKAACIAANKNAGDWDKQKLTKWLKDLSSFDTDFDLELTMFDSEELARKLGTITVSEHQRSSGESEKASPQPPPPPIRAKPGQTWALGNHRFICGESELESCDAVLAAYEDFTGEEAQPVYTGKRRKAEKHSVNNADA